MTQQAATATNAAATAAAATAPEGDAGKPDTVTPAAGAPANGEKAKRGRGASGVSVFPQPDEETAKRVAKEKGGKFTAFVVKSPAAIGKPDRFFVSNHRNAVQHYCMTQDGYSTAGILGGAGRALTPEKAAERAEKDMAAMTPEQRKALFEKFMGQGAFDLAAAQPGTLPPRQDTTSAAEFDAAPANGTAAAPKATGNAKAPAAKAPAAKATATARK